MEGENRVKYGLRNVHYAKATFDEDGNVTYDEPIKIPGAVNLSLDPEGDVDPWYADNILYATLNNNAGYAGELEIANIPEIFSEEILHDVVDGNEVMAEIRDAEVEHFALLFEFDGDEHKTRHVMYNCVCSRPAIESSTTEDTREPQTDTLSLTVASLANGYVKAKTCSTTPEDVYETWFETVYTPQGERTIKTYTVKFFNGVTLLQTVEGVPYNGSAEYSGETPVCDDDPERPFIGWEPLPEKITGDTYCYAMFKPLNYVNEIVDNTAFFAVTEDAHVYPTLGSDEWIEEMPEKVEDGQWLWFTIRVDYSDESSKWLEPVMVTDENAKEQIEVLAEQLKQSVEDVENTLKPQIEQAQTAATQAAVAAENAQATADEALNTAQDAKTKAESNELQLQNKVDDAYEEDGYLYLLADGEIVVGPLGPFAGTGGGGSSNNAVLTVTNTTGWLATTIADGTSCPVTIEWSSIEDGMQTGSGTLAIIVGGVTRSTRSIDQGEVTVDLAEYLDVGSNSVRVRISDVYGNSRTINFSITVVALSLESTFDASTPFTGDIVFTYIPTGSVEKTVYFYIDDALYDTATVTASGRQQSIVITGLSEGTHTLRVYFTAEINGEEVKSNELYYELMVISADSTETLITSSFDTTTVNQYETIVIPFYVYVPGSLTADEVVLAVNGVTVNTLTNVDRTEQRWSYRADEPGEIVLTISCNGTTRTFNITVLESDIHVEAETHDLELHLTSYGRSNSEADPSKWEDTDNNIAAELTGFNFASDGWQIDEDGITVLRVSGDARVYIPLQMFASDFRTTGKTIELEFATRDVRDYDSVLIECLSGDRGIRLTAQEAFIQSEQSYLSTQYKEDEHVRISFVVEKSTENHLIYCYINGIMSGIVQYPTSDDFSQLSPVGISIGSDSCTTDIYCIRVYKNNLSRNQIVDNWIADTQDGALMAERYYHNDVYDAYGQVVISQLPSDLPYLVLVGDLPEYKGNKLNVDGYFVDPLNSGRDFEFSDASIDVQGTSSAGYARKNYKIKFNETHTMFDNAVPTKTFTLKADVASSEGANNVELVRLYNDADPYRTPPQADDSRIRQGIDGFPMVVFHDDGESISFIGKYNWNNDKGTDEVYGFEDGDQSWETLNNTSDRVIWKSDDYSGDDWQEDFEARYPEDNLAIGDLAELAAWLVTTDQSAATGNSITSVTYDGITYTKDTAEYRLAKFKAEFSQHLEQDSTLFYYLFTELFLMVDSRAKNTFPTRWNEDGTWSWLPYDMDTAIGINNEGTLEFGYELEDIDHTDSGADVYNGQQSVLWINVREAFADEIQAMYQNLRSIGALSYDVIETAFEEHQAKWPEAIFNEDAYYKYIAPYEEEGTTAYFAMCQGSKAEQRKWWLYNRFKYLDSKYNAGDASADIITLRGYAKADITVTPFADIYAAIKYGSYLVQTRAERNKAYTLECPLDNVNDTEIYIYSCSQLADVGDLSGLKVGYADFSKATRLQAVKVGDENGSYSNANMTELYLGNNTLLQTVDARNCVSLSQTVDLSGCSTIKEVYLDGTSVPSVLLPNGGVLAVLHLPGTVTNLTIRNQPNLEDLTLANTSQITTLWLENVSNVVNYKAILETMAANSRVRIIGAEMSLGTGDNVAEFYDLLDTMRGLDENGNNTDDAQVSGTIYVDSISDDQLTELQARRPDIKIVYTHITCTVYFYTYDGSELLGTAVVADGGDVDDADVPTAPEREDTAQYKDFAFVGWSTSRDASSASSNALKNVTSNRTLYAAYSRTTQTYTVYFYNGDELLQVVENVPYGSTAEYTGDTPVSSEGDPETYPFEGWIPPNTNITGDTYCYAQFGSPYEEKEIEDDWDTILAKIADGTANYNCGNYKELDLGSEGIVNMEIVGRYTDECADGSGYAQYSWMSKELLATSHRMNPARSSNDDGTYKEGTGAIGGWEESEMREYLKETIWPLIPENVRAGIKTVIKSQTAYDENGSSFDQTTEDDIWIPSRAEVAANGTYDNVFSDNASRIKYKVDANSATYWWLRQADIATSFYCVGSGGSISSSSANSSYAVCLGFST